MSARALGFILVAAYVVGVGAASFAIGNTFGWIWQVAFIAAVVPVSYLLGRSLA